MKWWIIPIVLFGGFVLTIFVIWIVMSFQTFPNKVMLGEEYTIEDRKYKVPYLPHKTYQTKQSARLDRPVPMLDKKMLNDIRQLAIDLFCVLKDADVEFWLSGGSLLGALMINPFIFIFTHF